MKKIILMISVLISINAYGKDCLELENNDDYYQCVEIGAAEYFKCEEFFDDEFDACEDAA